jgi:hypothetical protein
MGMIKLLRTVATRDGATVLCTIHQPSSEIFELFDIVSLFLALFSIAPPSPPLRYEERQTLPLFS